MKKLLLICLTCTAIFLQGCDERITPANEQLGGGVSTPITGNKTDLIARKWVYEEINFDVDGKKTIVYGNNKTPNIKVEFLITPNDYFLFDKSGNLTVYKDNKKVTTKGTWKLTNSDKQVELTNPPSVVLYDIDNLNEKTLELSFTVVMANLDKETVEKQTIIAVAAFGDIIKETSKKVKYTMKLVGN
jgi:hypothetical protein